MYDLYDTSPHWAQLLRQNPQSVLLNADMRTRLCLMLPNATGEGLGFIEGPLDWADGGGLTRVHNVRKSDVLDAVYLDCSPQTWNARLIFKSWPDPIGSDAPRECQVVKVPDDGVVELRLTDLTSDLEIHIDAQDLGDGATCTPCLNLRYANLRR